MQPTLEVCVENTSGLDACVRGGANRVELCSALSLGGLTPSLGLMQAASALTLPSFAMIRPRAGGFCYSAAEVNVMLSDISAARNAGLAGVVLGAATRDNKLDQAVLEQLCHASAGIGRTLHRVIDTLSDPFEAIDQACDLGFERILSSGSALTAPQGTQVLKAMQDHAAGRIEIMVGSGLTAQNVGEVIGATGLWSIHASCSVADPATDALTKMGFAEKAPRRTDAMTIQTLKTAIARSGSERV